MWKIQSLLFDKKYFTVGAALYWAIMNDHKPIKLPHETENYIRIRLINPRKEKNYKTISLTEGIKAVIVK